MKKIAFFGSPEFAAKILEALVKSYDVQMVITQADKPSGRKGKLTETAVATLAKSLNLRVVKPKTLKDPEFLEIMRAAAVELFVVAAYGKIIPKNILDLVPDMAINIHASVLPKYRGASPIQSALLNGDTETGISIMLMDEQMDHGPVLLSETIKIGADETFPELSARLCILAQKLVLQAIPAYISGKLKPIPQEHSQATFCGMIKKEHGQINWLSPARNIYNQYRALTPWPGIWTFWNGQLLKITRCQLGQGVASDNGAAVSTDIISAAEPAGKVIAKHGKILVSSTSGYIELLELQLAGKAKTSINDFVRGHQAFVGTILGQ